MTHPYHLHAASAAWSLQAARAWLIIRVRDNAADALAGNTAVRDISIPSQVFGRRHALGGHGDPVGDLALASWRPHRPDPDAVLLADIDGQLVDLAEALPHPGPPLDRIRAAIPRLTPGTAARLTTALHRLDDVVRRRIQPPADEWPLPGAPECPACRVRGLTAQTSAPSGQWTVVCPDRCACAGDGCRCGMPVTAAGVPHIWTAQHPLVASLLHRHQQAA